MIKNPINKLLRWSGWRVVAAELPFCFAIGVVSFVLVMDLFLHAGRSITFDGRVHSTTIAQFSQMIADKSFPLGWSSGWSVYGFPLALYAHQLTSYLGAAINFIVHDPQLAYNYMYLLGAISSGVVFYCFIRLFTGKWSSYAASVLFTFAPYRIVNIYTRGALPEFFVTTFLILCLFGLTLLARKRTLSGFITLVVGVVGVCLTHPMMLIPLGVLVILYGIYVLVQSIHSSSILPLRRGGSLFPSSLISTLYSLFSHSFVVLTLLAGLIGLLISSYYIIPLRLDIKYVHYGLEKNHIRLNQAPTLEQLLSPDWLYFGPYHPGPPSENFKIGVIEVGVLLCGVFLLLQKKKKGGLLTTWLIISLISIALSLHSSEWLYTHIAFLGNIQYPWRMLSATIIAIPVVAALVFEEILNESMEKGREWSAIVFAFIVLLARVPAAYGKNYLVQPPDAYFYVQPNLHTANLTTIWMDDVLSYPSKDHQADIIAGQGSITSEQVREQSRTYTIQATSQLRLIDYTFYYPGWHAYVDGVETPIEFQDYSHKGVITYSVPSGTHTVELKFKPTKLRWVSYGLSVIGVLAFLGIASWLYSNERRRFNQSPDC
ncbi:hypothetical protein C5B42_05280 [Candidatus Cerribacteria bacterium 'Amazon FNV 2010 28 9']|uniref:Membrane protein 6-pyruvoyl-tetrahydropterin synthase-related domain-containing protein n=1 Tax=Candidatus Cerribacteria bacterium 'Amazon FNV 2010 28 9' TaxID=2081795 RepID=A0A317JMW6_9BACT|nr:MAG: hypothetical protein C5B42_05280 [Candidatus Cerribacteria bacterium 'Amazon FNV 2010 28 9']